MKTKFLRIGKSSLSMTLSLMMIVSTVFFGSFGTADAITTSDTASVDVVEDAAADINVDVEEADDAFADTTAIDETVSADVTEEDTAVDDKSVTVESSSVSTSVTTTNTKKTEKKTPEVSKADAPVASGYARIYFANNIVTNWKVPKVYVYGSCGENDSEDFQKSYVMTKSSTYDGLYYIDLKTETDGSIIGKLNFNGTANPSRGGTQTWDFGVYSNPLSISAGKVAVPYYITKNTKGQYGIRFAWVELNSSYCHRLYFDNSYTNWDTVCAYCSGEDKNNNTWPGQKMNYDGSSWYVNVYGDTDTINKSLSTCLIFNNGKGSQTVDITGAANNLDKIWKANSYDGTKYSGSWSAYTGSSSSTGTSANVDYHFIYGNNNDPSTFTNELPILKDSNNKYYVELPTEYGINYYFGISGSTSYENLYVQNSTPDQNITVTNSSASNVSTESKINYNIGDYTYYCSRVSTKSASVESVIIYIDTPGHAYTVSSNLNEHIKTSGPVTVVAKTGTVRNEFEKYSELSEIISLNYTDTSNSIDQSQNPGQHWSYTAYSGGQRVWIADNVERNREIEYTVQIKSDYKDTYYVKAFCINGETYGITNGASSDGKYTCKFTIDNDDEGPIEITPIYYYIEKAGEEYITLAVEDFSGDVKKLWGNTIACYAYYVGGNDKAGAAENNKQALGGYPGQPMVYINGSYYMQIPKKISNGSVIEGITLNNYVWDEIHARKLVGVQLDKDHRNGPTTAQIQARNCQTYDYDDFAALRESRSANKIIFNFKYRTYNNNDSKTDYPEIGNQPQKTNDFNMSFVTSKGGNGWDALVDYYDVPVDLFARRLVDENNKYLTDTAVKNKAGTDEVVYVVSDGYVAYYSHADDTVGNYTEGNGKTENKYVGQYATRWYVYTKNSDNTYKYIGALPPSAFLTGLTKDGDSANAKTYTPGDYTEDNFVNYANKHEAALSNAFSQWSDYENIYQACAGKPVVITYESNIYSNGVKGGTGTGTYRNDYDETYYYGTTQNPGYRCDGRWYYSKYNQTINATTKIKIIKKDSSGNVVTDDEGQIVYDDDAYKSTDPNVGTKTGASAYFTNTTANSLGKSYYGATSTTVYEDENDSFKFKSSSNTTGKYTFKGENEESDVIYKFVGWYLETGSGLLNPISKDVTGSRQMDSSANFVAVYEPVKVTERSLFIEHELYADLYDSLSSKEGVTAPKNGTGTPYIDSVVITKDNQTLYSNKTKVNGSVIVINDNDSNALVNGATVTVTLSATPANSDTTFDGVYIPKSEGGYVENNNENKGTTGTKANGDVRIATTSNGTTTYTYTYTISDDLFTDNKATLSHYSDFSTTLLSINFKYYDRVTSERSHTETISTTPSTVNVSASAKLKSESGETQSIANAITKALGEATKNESSPMSTLKNVIDNYYFWTSTNEATEGIKDFINYHVVDKDATNTTDITERYHTTYAKDYGAAKDENDKAILSYHLDCYGVPYKGLIDAENPSNADGYSAEAWVTYTKTDGSAPVTYKSTDNVDLTTVKSVTVWGYNAPRTYQVEVYKPGTSGDLTQDGNVYYTNTSGGSVSHEVITAFYNQRLAGKDENYDGSNSPSDYLTQYGITGYFGDDSAVTADEEITFADGETKVVFDGWYDANTHTKISSDRTYGYRVTTNLSLVAGYKSSKTSDTTKVSVIKNGVEPFIDADNQSRVRLTTVVNVYDNLDNDPSSENYLNPKDKDENIKKVSAIYVQLPVKDSNGEQIIWNSDNLAALKLDSPTEDGIGKAVRDYLNSLDLTSNEVKNSDTLTVTVTIDNVTINTEKIISYTYGVTFDSDDTDTNTTMLTNKNRVQFTLPMKAELYYGTGDVAGSNSAIIAYAAIYYDTTDSDTNDGNWIVSENHAEFIAPVVAGNSSSGNNGL